MPWSRVRSLVPAGNRIPTRMPSKPSLHRLSYRDSHYARIYVQACFPHKAYIRLLLLYCLSENRISIYCNNLEINYNCKFTSGNWWRRYPIILLEWKQRHRDEKRGCREIYMRVFLIRKRQVTSILICAVVICSVYVLLGGSAPHSNETEADTVVVGRERGWCVGVSSVFDVKFPEAPQLHICSHTAPILDCLGELHMKIPFCDSIPMLITTILSWVNVICYEDHSLHSLKLIIMLIVLHL
jgi:hypothetical protein